jgi:hypothetical protein
VGLGAGERLLDVVGCVGLEAAGLEGARVGVGGGVRAAFLDLAIAAFLEFCSEEAERTLRVGALEMFPLESIVLPALSAAGFDLFVGERLTRVPTGFPTDLVGI